MLPIWKVSKLLTAIEEKNSLRPAREVRRVFDSPVWM